MERLTYNQKKQSGRCVSAAEQIAHRPGLARRTVCAPGAMAFP